MRILVFCDPAYRAADFQAAFRGSGHALLYLTCNTAPTAGALRFYLAQIYELLRNRPLWLPALFLNLITARALLSHQRIDAHSIHRYIVRAKPDIALHALGVIYPEGVIAACGLGILNAHIGKLPRYRGRSVMEWSLMFGDETGITVFFLDRGIDTGERIVLFQPCSIHNWADLDSAKRHLFARDAELYARAVSQIGAGRPYHCNDVSRGFRFYEMSSLFRSVLQSNWHGALATMPTDEASVASRRNGAFTQP